MTEDIMINELNNRMARVEAVLERNAETQDRIARSLEKLVVLETQFAEHRGSLERAFAAVKQLEEKLEEAEELIGALKEKQPMIDMMLRTVGVLTIAGVLGFFGWVFSKFMELVSK